MSKIHQSHRKIALYRSDVSVVPHSDMCVVEPLCRLSEGEHVVTNESFEDLLYIGRIRKDASGEYRMGPRVTDILRPPVSPYVVYNKFSALTVEGDNVLIGEHEIIMFVDRQEMEDEFGPEPETN